jgi:hypothetical protein
MRQAEWMLADKSIIKKCEMMLEPEVNAYAKSSH